MKRFYNTFGRGMVGALIGIATVVLVPRLTSVRGFEQLARSDMQTVLLAQQQAYDHAAEAELGLKKLVEGHPKAALYMKIDQKCEDEFWEGPQTWRFCPYNNLLKTVNYIQSSHDALRITGAEIPPTVMHDINEYSHWVSEYNNMTDRYNLGGWSKTPTLYGFNPWIWNGTSP